MSLALGAIPCRSAAEEGISLSGRLKFATDYALDSSTKTDRPSVAARLELDDRRTAWNVHAWMEGKWAMDDDDQKAVAFKQVDKVYGNDNRPLELKELFIERERAGIDWRVGVQRFAWGRLDEYPINDLFNPWDYDQFIINPLEERKIGVPAVSAAFGQLDWSAQLVWVPWFVPYRLPDSDSRWALLPSAATREADLPARTLDNGSVGMRVRFSGEIESALYCFHGFDPRPVFGILPQTDPGIANGWDSFPFVPVFHTITSVGMDAATVLGPVSLRGEAAWTKNRAFNIRSELWADTAAQRAGTASQPSIERELDTVDYGMAADYRLFEDGLLTVQAQQTVLLSRPDELYERQFETLLWANFKVDWFNQKVETYCNLAYNPEHGGSMIRAGVTYNLTDYWKTNLKAFFFDGPPQSLFGRYAMNDQVRWELVYQW
ncbi:MAG: DUF1302 family protein [Desulfobulbus sp.]